MTLGPSSSQSRVVSSAEANGVGQDRGGGGRPEPALRGTWMENGPVLGDDHGLSEDLFQVANSTEPG